MLPDADDGELNWFNFVVEIEGPVRRGWGEGAPPRRVCDPAPLCVQATWGVVPEGGGADRPSPYVDGLFRIQVKIPAGYPAAPPEVSSAAELLTACRSPILQPPPPPPRPLCPPFPRPPGPVHHEGVAPQRRLRVRQAVQGHRGGPLAR